MRSPSPTRRAAGATAATASPFTSYGYNRVSDGSCSFSGGANDETNATIQFKPLTSNGGPTSRICRWATDRTRSWTSYPRRRAKRSSVTRASACWTSAACPGRAWAYAGGLQDPNEASCDVGAVELGIEKHFVCGPPLDAGHVPRALSGANDRRCAHKGAARRYHRDLRRRHGEGDGQQDDHDPGTTAGRGDARHADGHRAGRGECAGGNGSRGSVFTIQSGISVTIGALNIRYGDAVQGGGINNSGALLSGRCHALRQQGQRERRRNLQFRQADRHRQHAQRQLHGERRERRRHPQRGAWHGERQLQHPGQYRNEPLQR